jgi:hypothetical protein
VLYAVPRLVQSSISLLRIMFEEALLCKHCGGSHVCPHSRQRQGSLAVGKLVVHTNAGHAEGAGRDAAAQQEEEEEEEEEEEGEVGVWQRAADAHRFVLQHVCVW